MEDTSYSIYCQNSSYYGSTCRLDDLMVVKIFRETYDSENVCTEREVICKCSVCGGFYKRRYSATYYHSALFDTEEGWSVTDDYFKIEQPLWSGLNSSGAIPLTIEEARSFGYTGEDYTWKNGRCNFNRQNVELTCRARDLKFIAYRSPELKAHNHDKFYECRRCGQWYLFKILPPYTEALLKPSNELFPLEEARTFGYDETETFIINENKSPDSLVETWKEPPPLNEWLKAKRSEKERAEYAFLILRKHFTLNGLKVKQDETSLSWNSFGWDFYLNIDKFVREGERQPMLKNLLAELTDFCEAATGEFFAYYLFVMIEKFIDRDPPYSRFVPLLSAKALEKFSEIHEIMRRQHEEDLERQNQMGY